MTDTHAPGSSGVAARVGSFLDGLGHHSHSGVRGQFPGRETERVRNQPQPVDEQWLREARDEITRELKDAADLIRYGVRSVDQYEVNPVGDPTTSTSFIELFSDFSVLDEIIESVLVTGPVSTPFAIQLGKRSWNLQTNVQGFCLISPIKVKLSPTDKRTLTGAATTDITPAVPASTVAQQNTNGFPVTVVLSGFTATAVNVNGIPVGVSNGTYVVPAYGSISITYSVQGTWTWTPDVASVTGAGDWTFEIMGRPDAVGRRY